MGKGELMGHTGSTESLLILYPRDFKLEGETNGRSN